MSGWSSSALVAGLASTDASGKALVPPTWSMWAWVSTNRRTGWPISATAAANGSHCDRTIRQSMTVSPSSSATTPALLIPEPPPGCNQPQTPSPSFSSSTTLRRQDLHRTGGRDERRLVAVVPPHPDQRPLRSQHHTAFRRGTDLLRFDDDPSTHLHHGASLCVLETSRDQGLRQRNYRTPLRRETCSGRKPMAMARAVRDWRNGSFWAARMKRGTGRGRSESSTRATTPRPRARWRSWVAMVGNILRAWTRASWASRDLNIAPGIAPPSRAALRWGVRIRAAATASWMARLT